ncbi:putative arrestin-related trafficking adapter C2D10.04 [Fusarium austroafricanum]|uniref:Putative arrestin-related trafficking adapter C2D10.04 n=1 Tax=Fusarium austroafricanum TaxID=2364996 RepID=A0A8H4KQ43_9HYPO|nr:putative arrestin-related trafficking adapter C2D10.04 [Fusarium austroafricanum]
MTTAAPSPTQASEPAQRRSAWVPSHDNIYYRPRLNKKKSVAADRFPAPLIGPRRSRPQAIHIVSYPSGYIPRELRSGSRPQTPELLVEPRRAPSLQPTPTNTSNTSNNDYFSNGVSNSRRKTSFRPRTAVRRRDKLLSSLTFPNSEPGPSDSDTSGLTATGAPSTASTGIDRSTGQGASAISSAISRQPIGQSCQLDLELPCHSAIGSRFTGARPSPPAYDDITSRPGSAAPCLDLASASTVTTPLISNSNSNSRSAGCNAQSATAATMATARSSHPSLALTNPNRNSFMSARSSKSAISSVSEVPKPVASGSGVSCSILLAEPNIFLSGFDHDGHGHREGQSGTALLRGKLQLRVTKNVKIKAVQLKLLGRARTEWPEGIPPLKQDVYEEESLRTQVLTFFNAMNDGWESDYGNQCTYRLKSSSPNGSSTNLVRPNPSSSLTPHQNNLTAKEMKRLSLQSVQSRSFQKGDSPIATATQAKGYKVFYPGTYDYTFELPIDHHQLETTKLQYGSVKWELHATVDRAGAFKPNLHGTKEVSIVRVPDQLSLEMTEPISISRQWEDQLHYDIVISGKSFPIGSKIPIAFKLTPLAKVQVHKLKVYVTESIEYWTNDKRVTRKDPGRKILLLEKSAGKPLDSTYASSEIRTLRGGEPDPEQRQQAREAAARRRAQEASRRQTTAEPLPEPSANLLGDLDLGLETFWGSTEIEANVQIPTCEMMAKNKELRLNPDCSWKNVNVFHWIKVVMRISRIDPEDPTGTKRRHFEISIDSPFTVLNCRATHANTNLPAYTGANCNGTTYQSTCGCPDAFTVPTDASPSSSEGSLPGVNPNSENLPAPPQAAHLADGGQQEPRPIHLLRVPSFNPPAFEDDIAPPPAAELVTEPPEPVMTPPPQYDVVVGTPSVDGLADYFARLADAGYDGQEDSESDPDDSPPRILNRSGRVNVANPRTPGGRRMPSRSLEISRPTIQLDMSALRARAGRAV